MQIVEQWNQAYETYKSEGVSYRTKWRQKCEENCHKMSMETHEKKNSTRNGTKTKWLFMIGFLIESFADRFLGYFSSFSICTPKNRETIRDAFVIIIQWPRWTGYTIVGGCTDDLCTTKVTDQSVKIFIIMWKFIFFINSLAQNVEIIFQKIIYIYTLSRNDVYRFDEHQKTWAKWILTAFWHQFVERTDLNAWWFFQFSVKIIIEITEILQSQSEFVTYLNGSNEVVIIRRREWTWKKVKIITGAL